MQLAPNPAVVCYPPAKLRLGPSCPTHRSSLLPSTYRQRSSAAAFVAPRLPANTTASTDRPLARAALPPRGPARRMVITTPLSPRASLRHRRRRRRSRRLLRIHHRYQPLHRLRGARRRLHRRASDEVRLRRSRRPSLSDRRRRPTYLAIALAEIPIALWQFRARIPSGHMLAASMRLLPVGLSRPSSRMRSPIHGLINAVILFVGLQIAWRGTAATASPSKGLSA